MTKATIFTLIFLLGGLSIFAQIIPIQSPDEKIHSLGVKALSTYYKSLDEDSDQLIFSKEFDTMGKPKIKFQLSLWDAVSYSHSTSYSYNNDGLLEKEQKIQEILNLFDRDNDYIQMFGAEPLNEKIVYYYNKEGLLSKKALFTFGKKEHDKNASPDQSIDYQYENGLLISEESTSIDEKFFNQNYFINYSYDSAENIIQKSMAYGKEKDLQRSSLFKYDAENRLLEEQIIDTSIPHNSIHIRYEYNDEGKISNKYVFDNIEQEFELETTYKYDKLGNAISGDRDVKFEYYQNGLIKSETWTDPTSDKLISFMTTYEFF